MKRESYENVEQKLLQKLDVVGSKGLTKSKLLPKKTSPKRAAAEEALGALLSRRLIGNLGTSRSPRYVVISHYKPLELACSVVEAKAIPERLILYTITELGKGCTGAVKEAIPEAVALLVKEKKLLALKRGRSLYYLFTAPLREQLLKNEAEGDEPLPLDEGAVRRAYRQLVGESGLPYVAISRLQERAGVALDPLKIWLKEQSRIGSVVPSRGDWSLSDTCQREAAIEMRGEPHLLVQLLD